MKQRIMKHASFSIRKVRVFSWRYRSRKRRECHGKDYGTIGIRPGAEGAVSGVRYSGAGKIDPLIAEERKHLQYLLEFR